MEWCAKNICPPDLPAESVEEEMIAGGELPAGFADTFYDRVDELMRDPVHEGARDMGLMTPEVNQLLRTPSCKGALRSLLGESFAIATWGNGTPLLHANATPQSDQGWHKVLPPLPPLTRSVH